MRVVTYNIRNGRAVDWPSLWWRRRRRLAAVLGSLEADIVGLQEAYPAQIRWLGAHTFATGDWAVAGSGRNLDGGGEGVPLWHRRGVVRMSSNRTRWFGPAPDTPGSRFAGAQFPRIATIVDYKFVETDMPLTVVNLHLDSVSAQNRTASLVLLGDWLTVEQPTIVLGDFNAPMSEPGFAALTDLGLHSALPADAGPTSNGFGRLLDTQQQIDHVFVSEHFRVTNAKIATSAGHASDHYPVVVDLAFMPSATGER